MASRLWVYWQLQSAASLFTIITVFKLNSRHARIDRGVRTNRDLPFSGLFPYLEQRVSLSFNKPLKLTLNTLWEQKSILINHNSKINSITQICTCRRETERRYSLAQSHSNRSTQISCIWKHKIIIDFLFICKSLNKCYSWSRTEIQESINAVNDVFSWSLREAAMPGTQRFCHMNRLHKVDLCCWDRERDWG